MPVKSNPSRPSALCVLVALFCLFGIRLMPALAGDWPLPRHDAANTGLSTTPLPPPLHLLWNATGAKCASSVILASSGAVAIARKHPEVQTYSDTMLYSARSGRLLWTIPFSRPLYLHGRKLVIARSVAGGMMVECYDWPAHRLIWTQGGSDPHGPTFRYGGVSIGIWGVDGGNLATARLDATVRDGLLFLTWFVEYAPTTELRIVSLETGETVKTAIVKGRLLAVDEKRILVNWPHWLTVLNRETLLPEIGYYGGPTHVLLLGDLELEQGYGHGAGVMDLATRKGPWGVSAWRDPDNALAMGKGGRPVVLLGTPIPQALAAFDVATGALKWRYRMWIGGYGGEGGIAGAGPYVYAAGWHEHEGPPGIHGGFYALDARTGRLIWKFERPGVCGVGVIVADGAVYGLDSNGTLYSFVPGRRPRGALTSRSAAHTQGRR